MANDLYGKKTEFGNSTILTANVVKMSVKTAGGGGAINEGFLVQNITIQYNQPLNRIYEIGSDKVYFAPGRSIGTMQLGRIIGNKPITAIFGATGEGLWTPDGVGAADRVITLTGNKRGTGTGAPVTLAFNVTGAVVESYGFSTDANGILVQENVTIQFAGLYLRE